jgi:hypothetical protein
MNTTRSLVLILVSFVILGVVYATVTPPFEASDELWHYPLVRHLADGNPLPVQAYDAAEAGPWKQEASQPPLYYYLAAALTFWIDTSDMDQVRWLNPHVDNGLITADGNINLAIHDPGVNQWQGTLLALHVVRLFSVLLGAGTVYLTFRIAEETVPGRPEIALGAAAANAFTPMFLFISGAVNNDNLAIPLASLAVLLMILARRRERDIAYWLLLGSVIGLALLTKEGTFALLPLAWGTIFVARWRYLNGRVNASAPAEPGQLPPGWLFRLLLSSFYHFALLLLPVVVIASWWYARNVRLYGDWLGWSAFIAVLGQRAQPASLLQLWSERRGFMMSYWGLFGGVNVPMGPWVYRLLNGTLLVSIAGFVLYLALLSRPWTWARAWPGRRWPTGELVATLFHAVESHFGLVLSFLFSGAVVYGLVQWATATWSSQGRLVFTAISALNVLMVCGLAGWLPRSYARPVVAILSLFMFVIALSAPFAWIRPAYQPESYTPGLLKADQPVAIGFDDPEQGVERVRLLGYAVQPLESSDSSVHPGESVDVLLTWEVRAEMDEDWSIFVHLDDPILGTPVAQRDMYPGQGLRPTSLLEPGEMVRSFMRLLLPQTLVAPAELELNVGWYEFYSGDRLRLASGEGDAATLALLKLLPAPGTYPNPTAVDFGGQLELVGYDLSPRRAKPGQTIDLALYWRASHALSVDYTFFAQVVDQDTTLWASNDMPPPGGTTSWQMGEVYTLNMPLSLSPDTPPAVYPIHLGMYTRDNDGGFHRLQIVAEDGRITQENFLRLALVRVD